LSKKAWRVSPPPCHIKVWAPSFWEEIIGAMAISKGCMVHRRGVATLPFTVPISQD